MSDFDIRGYESESIRTLPMILLLDVSDSMNHPPVKIDSLNQAISEMIDDFKQMPKEMNYVLSVITFGGKATFLYNPPYKDIKNVQWTELKADSNTPMGMALKMAKDLIDNEKITNPGPEKTWYSPVVVLVSDGQPNDKWETPMKDFITGVRSAKSQRMAMAIGQDADENVLKRFLEGTNTPLFYARDAKSIKKFFKYVTMSVKVRVQNTNPNFIPPAPPIDDPENSSNTGTGVF